MKNIFTLSIATMLLAACTSDIKTTLKNPETGEVVTCSGKKTNMFSVGPISVGSEEDSCVQNYLNKGYERQSAIGGIF